MNDVYVGIVSLSPFLMGIKMRPAVRSNAASTIQIHICKDCVLVPIDRGLKLYYKITGCLVYPSQVFIATMRGMPI